MQTAPRVQSPLQSCTISSPLFRLEEAKCRLWHQPPEILYLHFLMIVQVLQIFLCILDGTALFSRISGTGGTRGYRSTTTLGQREEEMKRRIFATICIMAFLTMGFTPNVAIDQTPDGSVFQDPDPVGPDPEPPGCPPAC